MQFRDDFKSQIERVDKKKKPKASPANVVPTSNLPNAVRSPPSSRKGFSPVRRPSSAPETRPRASSPGRPLESVAQRLQVPSRRPRDLQRRDHRCSRTHPCQPEDLKYDQRQRVRVHAKWRGSRQDAAEDTPGPRRQERQQERLRQHDERPKRGQRRRQSHPPSQSPSSIRLTMTSPTTRTTSMRGEGRQRA